MIPRHKTRKSKYHEENFTSFDVQGAGEILIGNNSKSRTGTAEGFSICFLGKKWVRWGCNR